MHEPKLACIPNESSDKTSDDHNEVRNLPFVLPDSQQNNRTITANSIAKLEQLATFKVSANPIYDIEYSETGMALAVSSINGKSSTVILFEPQETLKSFEFINDSEVRELAWLNNDQLARSINKGFDIQDIQNRLTLCNSQTEFGSISSLEFSRRSNDVAFVANNNNVNIMHNGNWKVFSTLTHKWSVTTIAFNPNRDQIFTSTTNDELIMWDIKDETKLWSRPIDYLVFSATFDPQGEHLVIASDKIRFLNPATGKIERELPDSLPQPVIGLTFFSDSEMLGAILHDKLGFWNAKEGRLIDTIELPNKITAFAINPQNSMLTIGLDNGEIQIWSIPN